MPLKVLLVENESTSTYSVKADLLDRGDQVAVVTNPKKVLPIAISDWPDLIVLNGCTSAFDIDRLCQKLDDTRLEFPCLIVSHVDTRSDSGYGVYLSIPFSARQLSQHIKKAVGDQVNRFVRAGDVTLDGLKRQVQRSGRTANLTPKEFKLLHLLMRHADEVLNRRIIMKEVWETDYLGDTRTLDVHIRWVREKLEDDPSHPHYIVTVRGVGYRFSLQES